MATVRVMCFLCVASVAHFLLLFQMLKKRKELEMSKCVKLPEGKMCSSKTLCGECFWLDKSDGTNDFPRWYWCKRVGTYKDPELNTSCPHWNKDD